MAVPEFTLTPQPRNHEGARVKFECQECGHEEVFVRLRYADIAHVLASDHYRGECPETRWADREDPMIAAHRTQLAQRHRL
jgi:hypothetical protein